MVTSFFAVFFSLANKTYTSILETEERVMSLPKTKLTNPVLDTSFLDLLESQYNFSTQDLNLNSRIAESSTSSANL